MHQCFDQPEKNGVPHGLTFESPKRETQTGTADLHHTLVDDDPMVCMAIEIYLQRNHFRVTIADGGEAASALSRTNRSI
ncbi:hypothetical protein ABIC01_008164 [Bradyrhizobium sp. RT4b]